MYNPGDVVLCKFPNDKPPPPFKSRPALVVSILHAGSLFNVAPITTVNRSHVQCGQWIDEKHSAFNAMGLALPSFVNLSGIKPVPTTLIIKLIGTCPIMAALKKDADLRGIKF